MANDLPDLFGYDFDPVDETDLSQFADDNQISNTDRNVSKLTARLQHSLDLISNWSIKWGFKLSKEKTVAVLFGNNNKNYNRDKQLFNLTIRGEPIQVESSAQFLGLIFDQHLTFKPQIDKIIKNCTKSLNLLRAVSGTSYGSDKPTLLMLYQSLIRSKLEYGCQAFQSAPKTYLKKLNKIQYSALTTVLGSHKSTKHEALLVESGELPLDLRWEELTFRYWCRILAQGNNNAAFAVSQPPFLKIYQRYKVQQHWDKTNTGPFGYRVYKQFMKPNAPFENLEIEPQNPPQLPPWTLHAPTISTEIRQHVSKKDLPALIRNVALEIIERKYSNFVKIYTDGSKDPTSGLTGAGIFDSHSSLGYSFRCQTNMSICSAELLAIVEALDLVKGIWDESPNNNYKNIVILSDSLSAIQAIQNRNSARPDLVNWILSLCHSLTLNYGCLISIEWVPAHVDIYGNEEADKYAKLGLDSEDVCDTNLGHKEVYPLIRRQTRTTWQNRANPLNLPIMEIKSNISTKTYLYHNSKRIDRAITRLRLRRTLLDGELGKYILKTDPICPVCNVNMDTEHYLLHCPTYNTQRTELIDGLKTLGYDSFTLKTILDPPKHVANAAFKHLGLYIVNTNKIGYL